MRLNLGKAHGWIVDDVARRRPTNDSMNTLVDLCQSATPHPDWAGLRSLPYADLSPLSEWVSRPFRDQPPVRPLRGLWFGLFNPYHDGEALADIYVSGSERFDPSPDSNEWAVKPDWWPDARHASSTVLADIYRIAYRDGGLGNDAEYPLLYCSKCSAIARNYRPRKIYMRGGSRAMSGSAFSALSVCHCLRSSTGRGSRPSSHSTHLSGGKDGSVDSMTHDKNSMPPFR
jgi:hypothetical protein